MITKFVNLTPHDVTIVDENGKVKITFKPSGKVARVNSSITRTMLEAEVVEGLFLHLPVRNISEDAIVDLPEPEEGTILITSFLVAQAVKRADVYSPITDDSAFRDSASRIIGVRGLQTYA